MKAVDETKAKRFLVAVLLCALLISASLAVLQNRQCKGKAL